jgi:outer membrane receptor protein involved in Fe transport
MLFAVMLATVIAAASPAPSPSPSSSPGPASIGSVTVVSGSPQSLHQAPQAASVLDAATLRAATAPALDQALRLLPGYDHDRSNAPFTNYGQLRLSFAGAGNDRGALFVDGVPAQDGFGGQVDWNAYPAGSIERAELLRGPGSALYGSGAIGGVLSLLTTPPSNVAGGRLDAATGGTVVGDGLFNLTGGVGAFSNALTLSSDRMSYAVIPPGQTARIDRPAISGADVAHLRTQVATPGGTLNFDALESDDAQQDGRPNDGFSRSLRQAAASWTQGVIATLAVTAFVRETTVVNLADMTNKPGSLLYTQHVPSSDAGLRARWDRPLGGGDFSIVAERRLVTGQSTQNSYTGIVQTNVSGSQELDGLALQQTWDGRLGAIAGLRYDTIATQALGNRYAAALSPRLALRYDASRAVALRAAYGTGLRAPFLNELIRSYRVGKIVEESNPKLVPERSRSFQLGADIAASSNARFAVDYTGTRVVDAIGFSTISANLQQRSNFGRTASDAFTGEYEHDLGCTRLRAFATSQHDRVIAGQPDQIGKRLAYDPDSAAALDVDRTVHALTGTLELSYSGPTFADDLERQPLGSAFLIGGRLTLHAADGSALSLAVDNLSDRIYLTSVDRLGPPSSVTLRLSVPVGPRFSRRAPPSACG